MYSPEQLNGFQTTAIAKGLPTYRVDFVEQCGCTTNYAIGITSYQEAVCMADSCFANDNPKSVSISQEA